jgi:hypothetical protein
VIARPQRRVTRRAKGAASTVAAAAVAAGVSGDAMAGG